MQLAFRYFLLKTTFIYTHTGTHTKPPIWKQICTDCFANNTSILSKSQYNVYVFSIKRWNSFTVDEEEERKEAT